MAVTVNITLAREGTGACAHLEVTGTLTAPGLTRSFTLHTTKAELLAPLEDDDFGSFIRVLTRIIGAQIPNKTPAQIVASFAAKTIDLTVT
jgi:hypothetical protein